MGVNDKIERYLLVRNGHDGKTPITYANTSIRAVCQNTVNAGIKSALRVFTARHTRNQDTAIEQAQKVLNISTEWAKDFQETAETRRNYFSCARAISLGAKRRQLRVQWLVFV
jgi:hypothetical protein